MFESMEARRLLTTTGVFSGGTSYFSAPDGVTASWTVGDDASSEYEQGYGLRVNGSAVTADTYTLDLAGLPAHSMARVEVDEDAGPWRADNGSGTLNVAAGSGVQTTSYSNYDNPYAHSETHSADFGKWFASSDSSLSITLSAENFTRRCGYFVPDVTVAIYQPTVSISGGGDVAEDGDPLTMTVSRDGDASMWNDALTVPITTSGVAIEGDDYTLSTDSVTIPAGQGSAPLTFTPILDDQYAEDTESFDIAVTPMASKYQIGTGHAVGNLQNARLSITLDTASVTVKNDGTNGTVKTIVATVKVGSKPKAGVSLKYALQFGATGTNPDITFSGASGGDGKVTITVRGQWSDNVGLNVASSGTFNYKIDPTDAAFFDDASLAVTVSN